MLEEQLLGESPSRFKRKQIIGSFIISEVFLWSSWNFVTPIFAIFVASKVSGGNIETAAFSFSFYLIGRVIMEIISGRLLCGKDEDEKLKIAILGIVLLSVSYLGFAVSRNITAVFAMHTLAGIGFGISSPAKYALFSSHLEKSKESKDWGNYDAAVFFSMALAAALGGVIAKTFGFDALFLISAVINFIAIIPYLLCLI